MNLNDTWKYCMSMWRWIAEQKRKGSKVQVEHLKVKWLEEHGFGIDDIADDCFFCDYRITHKKRVKVADSYLCSGCPAVFIDREFTCNADDSDYHYSRYPIAFYNKIRALNRKRKKR